MGNKHTKQNLCPHGLANIFDTIYWKKMTKKQKQAQRGSGMTISAWYNKFVLKSSGPSLF